MQDHWSMGSKKEICLYVSKQQHINYQLEKFIFWMLILHIALSPCILKGLQVRHKSHSRIRSELALVPWWVIYEAICPWWYPIVSYT